MDINRIRSDFPILHASKIPLIYFDNAATTQKPNQVIERIQHYYRYENANIHRGDYPLSHMADKAYEHARSTVAKWIDAENPQDIIFTKSSTESINLVASALFEEYIGRNDNVLVSELEHSSNYFPWKAQCQKHGCEFRVVPVQQNGTLKLQDFIDRLDSRTKLVAISGMSNVTGYRPDIQKIISAVHKYGALVLIDATQLIVHEKISAKDLDCDFLSFSGHKLYGPMGIGILYVKKDVLEQLPPFLYGGDMIQRGDNGEITYKDESYRYEAGTQNIEGVLGLESAIQYLDAHHFQTELLPYEQGLGEYLYQEVSKISGVKILGNKAPSTILNFTVDGLGAYDIGTFLGNHNIAVRSGAHCAYPLMKKMGTESSVRVSLSFYNTAEEISEFVGCIEKLKKMAALSKIS
jgi:cysteine desulfurase/selenocysteine lyase